MKKFSWLLLIIILLEAVPINKAELDPPPIFDDALVAPPSTLGFSGTSNYMIGKIAVGILLPESDGKIDPSTEDWTEDEIALVLAEIRAALDWWVAREPRAHLEFIVEWERVPIPYEPINHTLVTSGPWIQETVVRAGFEGSPSHFDTVRTYNNYLLDTYDADMAFTIFVVDSSNDQDGRFADGRFAYAYLGGPFTVITYDNDGYGSHNMDAVAAHEIGHIFLALDQYYAAHQPCSRTGGILNIENQNSQYGDDGEFGTCLTNEPSLMRGQVWPYRHGALDWYARGQVGWRDSDGDGVLDPVDDNGERHVIYLPIIQG